MFWMFEFLCVRTLYPTSRILTCTVDLSCTLPANFERVQKSLHVFAIVVVDHCYQGFEDFEMHFESVGVLDVPWQKRTRPDVLMNMGVYGRGMSSKGEPRRLY